MFKDIIKKSRSYRRFEQTIRIPVDTLVELVDSVRYTPSAHNLQPLKYYICTNEEENDCVFKTIKWAAYLSNWEGPAIGERPTAYILILVDKHLGSNSNIVWCETGIASQTILLHATYKGYGGCMIGAFKKEVLSQGLSLSENDDPILVIALGCPKENIVIEDIGSKNSVKYYRDENNNHHVPKKSLESILLNYKSLK